MYGSPVGDWSSSKIWPRPWWSSNGFGAVYDLTPAAKGHYHTGVDLMSTPTSATLGAPLRTIGGGYVMYCNHNPNSTFGLMVVIHHGFGVCSRYAHLDSVEVAQGDELIEGDVFGTIGGSGKGKKNFWKPHLHFDISTSGILLTKPDYWPGRNRDGCFSNFVNPLTWLVRMKNPFHKVAVSHVKTYANVRSYPSFKGSTIKGGIIKGVSFNAEDLGNAWYRILDGKFPGCFIHESVVEKVKP